MNTLSRHHWYLQSHLFILYRVKELCDLEQATIKSFWILDKSLKGIASTKAAYCIQKHESLNAKGIIIADRGYNRGDAYLVAQNILSGYGFSECLSIRLGASPRNYND